MTASGVFHQQNGEVTTAYYARLNQLGPAGQVAVALFRAQKRSSRAKDYRRGRYRRMAYDVKSWSIDEACRLLEKHGDELGIRWGWKEDPTVLFGERASWVLYVDLPVDLISLQYPGELGAGPSGQVSFHSPHRGKGPDYLGAWDGQRASEARILAFCDAVVASCGGSSDEFPTRRTTPLTSDTLLLSEASRRKPAGNADAEGM